MKINKKFYICPYTRMEVLLEVEEGKQYAFCSKCRSEHLLPDGNIYKMKEQKDLNMFSVSW